MRIDCNCNIIFETFTVLEDIVVRKAKLDIHGDIAINVKLTKNVREGAPLCISLTQADVAYLSRQFESN